MANFKIVYIGVKDSKHILMLIAYFKLDQTEPI